MNKSIKIILGFTLIIAAVGVFGASSVFAAEKIGTVTGRDGDVKDTLSMTAEIISVDGSHVTFKDVDSDEEYTASFGPSWFTKVYAEGEKVNVVGVETEEDNNDNNHNFQVMEVDGTVLRTEFEGRPAWAGTRSGEGSGEGQGQSGERRGGRQGARDGSGGSDFVDADGNGICDNAA